MKKTYLVIAIAAATIALVSAEDTTGKAKVAPKPLPAVVRKVVEQGAIPPMTTGDANIDAQVKALNMEMEAKVKAIRDDYLARIKAIVGDKKPLIASSTRPGMGSTTRPMLNDEKKMDRPMMGSTTPNGGMPGKPPMMQRGEVKGVSEEAPMGDDMGSRLKNFFRGILGGE